MQLFLDFTRELAHLSGDIIRPYFRHASVETKADDTPVTAADRGAERAMRERIQQRFPDHGILGEEFGNHQPDAEYQWVLDPIDGTKTFVAHCHLFGTLIALLRDGQPLLGAIHQPILGDLLLGDGQQTWLNGDPVSVRPCAAIEEAVLTTTDHWNVHRYRNGRAFEGLAQRARLYRTWGDCYGYYLLATGGIDVMTDPILAQWDLMALIPIVEGAGGRMTDWHGEPILAGDEPGANGAVATAGGLHDEVIRLLNP